ncbi:hypothetical protein [Neisseria meningitidis]|uniref:hypothetical protein n=1 Tax=Neisseria meningitidis TaxID=487 RepID=UPI0015D59B0A|nr:hypothetical protein [Neisseria meningitidis]
MVGFQEVVEIWGVYWFGRRLGRGWEFLFWEVEKGRLKWVSDDLSVKCAFEDIRSFGGN